MYTDKPELVDGLAYLEFSGVYTLDRNKNPLISKKGEPMFNVAWSVTDSRGNVGKVYDLITSSTMWKVHNIENATGKKGFFSAGASSFNIAPLAGASCGASIAKDEYGPKIKMYLPMAFYKMVLDPNVIQNTKNSNPPASEGFKTPPAGQSPSSHTGVKAMFIDEDDGIPF